MLPPFFTSVSPDTVTLAETVSGPEMTAAE